MLQNKSENESLFDDISWPEYYFDMIQSVKKKSKDKHTKFGCIITGPGNEIRTTGFNSFPRKLNDYVPERYERPEKYFWMVHAERNAIFNAARMGTPLDGCIAYINGLPCGDCAQGLIQVGIQEVIYDAKFWQEFVDSRNKNSIGQRSWLDDIEKAITMLLECGVRVTPFTS